MLASFVSQDSVLSHGDYEVNLNYEENQLTDLNRRLNVFIKKNDENQALQLKKLKETYERSTLTSKNLHEEEVDALKEQIQNIALEKDEIEAHFAQIKEKFEQNEQDLSDIKNEYEQKIDDLESSRDREIDEKNRIFEEKENLSEEGTRIQDDLQNVCNENEMLKNEMTELQNGREVLESKIEDLKVTLSSKTQKFTEEKQNLQDSLDNAERELNEIKTIFKDQYEEKLEKTRQDLAEEYNARLEDALLNARDQHERENEEFELRLNNEHQEELSELNVKMMKNESLLKQSIAKLKQVNDTNDELRRELSNQVMKEEQKEAEKKELENQLVDVKKSFEQLQADYEEQVNENDSHRRLLDEVAEENSDLRTEIDYTFKMIEQEEARMGMKFQVDPKTVKTNKTSSRVFSDNYPQPSFGEDEDEEEQDVEDVGSKRSKNIEFQLQSSINQHSTTFTLDEVDPEGNFFYLKNNSKKPVDLSTWVLRASSASRDYVDFHFPDNITLKGSEKVAVLTSQNTEESDMKLDRREFNYVLFWTNVTSIWANDKGSVNLFKGEKLCSAATITEEEVQESPAKRFSSYIFGL